MIAKSNKSLVVIGAGAIGGVTAALFKKAGLNVEIVCKYPDLARKISEDGIHVMGTQGDHVIKIPAVASISDLSGKKDFIFLSVKATDLPPILTEITSILKHTSRVVVMQNGICEDLVATKVPKEQVVGCVTGWGATMHEKGKVEKTSTGEFVIGYLNQQTDDYLFVLKQIMNEIVPTKISHNIYGALYSKLIINSCITSLGAVCGLYLGEMLSNKLSREIFIQIMREAMDVAAKFSYPIEVYAGKLDYIPFLQSSSKLASLKRHAFIRIIGLKYKKLKSSSLQSLERGKPTEIDYFNGYIVAKGQEFGVSTPMNIKIVEMIKSIERKELPISAKNLETLGNFLS